MSEESNDNSEFFDRLEGEFNEIAMKQAVKVIVPMFKAFIIEGLSAQHAATLVVTILGASNQGSDPDEV